MDTQNNRKRTSGRKYRQVQLNHCIGFTVIAKPINDKGKKTNISFSQFVPVKKPNIKINSQLPTKYIQVEKLEAWANQIEEARKQADKIANKQKFETIVLAKMIKTSNKVFVK